jgi:homoserine kinase
MRQVSVTVPASTANLGPGFDCLALALDLTNTIEVETTDQGMEITIEGEGAHHLPHNSSNLCYRTIKKRFEVFGRDLPGLHLKLTNCIPPSSGLGSSSATIVGGMLAADALLKQPLDRLQILHLAKDLEGHADNAAASLFGGLIILGGDDDELVLRQVSVPIHNVAVAVPLLSLPTKRMRQVLPRQVSLQDAVFNTSHTALTIEALREGDYDLMAWSMRDKLHQSYRIPLIPDYAHAENAAYEAGAVAVTLSGAGPALVAFAPDGHDQIAEAMAEVFTVHDIECKKYVLPIRQEGANVTVN